MRKGLNFTLMTVAIALISVQAMALAPVIEDLPSPVVGSYEPITGGSRFVYTDAFDLNDRASDPEGLDATQLLWTYTTVSGSHYSINGIAGLTDLSSGNITNPPNAFVINKTGASNEWNVDGKWSTITIRNKFLSPLPAGATPGLGTAVNNDSGIPNGIIASETEPVTFFCSDGDKYTSATVLFYSDQNEPDRLSGRNWSKVKTESTFPWTINSKMGTVDMTTSTIDGLCFNNVGLTGTNMADFVSTLPYFQLGKNVVYRIKMQMNGNQLTPGKTPLWDFIIENAGLLMYSQDEMFFDNVGGANAVTSAGMLVTMYWCPPAASTAQWNDNSTGALTAAYDGVNDPRMRFRLLDVDAVAASQAQLKSGQVCIKSIMVESIPLANIQVVRNVYSATSLAKSGTTGGNVSVSNIFAGNISAVFSGGAVTITPLDQGHGLSGRLLELVTVAPETTGPGVGNFPITWTSNKLLRLTAGLSAPDANSALHPWDAYIFSFETRTDEVLLDSMQTTNVGQAISHNAAILSPAAPRVGSAQTYTAFFYTQKETVMNDASYHFLRWKISLINHPSAFFPSGSQTIDGINWGAVTISNIKVDEVK